MRLLVWGHWSHGGFGVVTEELCTRFLAAGVDVRILAANHRGEPVKGPLAGRVWPFETLYNHFHTVSASAIDGTLWGALDSDDTWKPDAMLAIADVSGLTGYMGRTPEPWSTLPVYHYCPIEGDNLPPFWRHLWKLVRPVAMSDYGQRVIGELTGEDVPRIYHGVDTEAFYPVSPGKPIRWEGKTLRSKDECRAAFLIDPSLKVILRTDRNATRKNYPDLIRAFVDIARGDPDVMLVMHCRPIDIEGPDLMQEHERLPEDVKPRVRFTGAHDTFRGLSREGLNALYNAADLYMSTTGGEGFGLTLAEAAACGVPVICTDWAAEREVVGAGGVLVPPLHDSYGDPVRYHSKFGMDWAVPDGRAFVEPALRLLAHPGQRKSLGALGRLHIQRSFSWDAAASEFLDLFSQAEEAAA